MKTLEIEFLDECFTYDSESGKLHWNTRPESHFSRERIRKTWNARFAGNKAGTLGRDGYYYVHFGSGRWAVHRIIYAMVHRKWPEADIDHIDGDPANNRIENLRAATRSQNLQNRRKTFSNRVGFKGVGKHKGLYRARIRLDGKQRCLGYFKTPEAAHAAYCEAANDLFKDFARYA